MMNQSKIKENIACLLEEIMQRSLQINKSKNNDALLDIDLVMEDMRHLYREYASLRQLYEAMPDHSENKDDVFPETGAEESPAFSPEMREEEVPQPPPPDVPGKHPEEVPPAPRPGETPPFMPPEEVPPMPEHTPQVPPVPETPEPDPEVAQAHDAEEQTRSNGMPEPEVINQEEEKHAEQEIEQEEVRQAEEPEQQPPVVQTHEEKNQNDEQENPPIHTPVAAPEVPAAKPAARKAIIDLFSEPSGKAIGDNFNQEDNSLHQRISQTKRDSSISARMQQKPIDNIKDAIGVNDKFLFINELFHGNIQAYNEAIQKLNGMDNLQSAFDFLNGLTESYSWDEKRSGETIEKLANFVQRRHIS